jgi:hypothetical protein
MSSARVTRQAAAVVVLGLMLVACGGGSATTTAPSSPAVSSAPSTRDGPPEAALAAEGGDPVVGQLGSYTWGDGGSDSPWLGGSPVRVGAGESLTLTLDPAVGIASWRARYVPADATDPAGAISLGEGTGPPSFPAPAGGPWTVEVAVDFAEGQGTASYFWRLDAG